MWVRVGTYIGALRDFLEAIKIQLPQKRAVFIVAKVVHEDPATELFHVGDAEGQTTARPLNYCIIYVANDVVKFAWKYLRKKDRTRKWIHGNVGRII